MHKAILVLDPTFFSYCGSKALLGLCLTLLPVQAMSWSESSTTEATVVVDPATVIPGLSFETHRKRKVEVKGLLASLL